MTDRISHEEARRALARIGGIPGSSVLRDYVDQQEADTVSREEHEAVKLELEAELRIAWEEEPSEKAGELPPLPQTSPFPQVARATAFDGRRYGSSGGYEVPPPQPVMVAADLFGETAPAQPERATAWVPNPGDRVQVMVGRHRGLTGAVTQRAAPSGFYVWINGSAWGYDVSELAPAEPAPPQPAQEPDRVGKLRADLVELMRNGNWDMCDIADELEQRGQR